MERLTKRLQELNGLCIAECEKECTEGYYECHKCKPFADVMKKLADYEDAEEQGLLLKLPCKVGDTVFHIHTIPRLRTERKVIAEVKTDSFFLALCVLEGRFGKTVFLTKEEAEQALAEMKGEN